ncbi:hypothetical protein WJX73_010363 [Symbiochloris irregularis]|uniref:Uncharacterized protein n=1 Tax=Symbiochloris irregularis TaxID=706552 RepID=A0AAW1NYX4_9CHLO
MPTYDRSSSLDYAFGALAGTANITAGYPFDSVKVRLQTSVPGRFTGPWHCLRHIVATEGVVRGLYRGMSAPVIGGALETAVNYGVYRACLRSLQADEQSLQARDIALAAGSAGFILSFILSPFELIKCRMQLGVAAGYTSTHDCVRRTLQQEGLLGLTRGLGGTIARETPGNALFFTVYEKLRQAPQSHWLQQQSPWLQKTLDLGGVVTAGGCAGMVMWATVLPIDVAKTRIQTALPGTKYDVGILRSLKQLYQEGGVRVLYAGLTPTLIRAFPANAAQWLTWDVLLRVSASV